MAKTFEIYFDDLKEEKQKEFLEMFGDNGNYDIYPMATLEFEEDEDKGD